MSRRPNVIFVLCDQLRAFELGCYGHPTVRTPNIDRLAAQSVRFETAVSNNPVCTPARSCLISGQYSRTCTGMLGNWGGPEPERIRLKDPTLAETLGELGYSAGHLGKWHICPHPSLVGFDNHPAPGDDESDRRMLFPTKAQWEGKRGAFSPQHEMDLLTEYLDGRDGDPFFLFYNINLPHSPWDVVPHRYHEMYSRDEVVLRGNVREEGDEFERRWYHIYNFGSRGKGGPAEGAPQLPADYDLVELHRHYYGMISCIDDQVGFLLDQLDRCGLAEDTILVFTSDHGDNLGSHHMFNKETMNEESIRIPMLIRWPGELTPRTEARQIATLVDLAATVHGLLGTPVPAHMQGTDLSPVLRGEQDTAGENVAYVEGMQDDVAVRTPTHLYGIRTEGGWNNHPPRTVADDEVQFYDLTADPLEMNNLARTDQQRDTAAELRRKVIEWDRNTPWMSYD